MVDRIGGVGVLGAGIESEPVVRLGIYHFEVAAVEKEVVIFQRKNILEIAQTVLSEIGNHLIVLAPGEITAGDPANRIKRIVDRRDEVVATEELHQRAVRFLPHEQRPAGPDIAFRPFGIERLRLNKNGLGGLEPVQVVLPPAVQNQPVVIG